MNIAICFLTRFNNELTFNYDVLVKHANESKNHKIDIYTYIHNEIPDYIIKDNNIYFSYRYLCKKYDSKFFTNVTQKWNYYNKYAGLMIYPFVDLYVTHPNYDMYMFFEDDVLLNIVIDNFFDSVFNENFDVLFQTPRNYDEKWYWNNNYNNARSLKPYEGLLNIYAFSNNFFKNFYKNIIVNNSIYAHHEYLVNGYVMEQLRHKIHISYLDDIYKVQCVLHTNEVIYDKGCQIIHPIKTIEQYNKFN